MFAKLFSSGRSIVRVSLLLFLVMKKGKSCSTSDLGYLIMLFTHEISDNLINDHDIGMKYKAFPNEDVRQKKR